MDNIIMKKEFSVKRIISGEGTGRHKNIGIGTTGPTSKLHVNGGDLEVKLKYNRE